MHTSGSQALQRLAAAGRRSACLLRPARRTPPRPLPLRLRRGGLPRCSAAAPQRNSAQASVASPPVDVQPAAPSPATAAAAAAAAAATSNGGAATAAPKGSDYGALDQADFAKFVQFFRQASPYIEGHRGRVFVIVIPGEVVMQAQLLQSLMADIGLLHGLGVRVVVVLGASPQINNALTDRGAPAVFRGGYRITDATALEAAVEAAGRSRTAVEQFLSRGPCVPVFRRHVKGDSEMHFGPALSVVSGNYVAAKRRGVVDGIDFGFTGEVRFVIKDAIRRQLDSGNIVLLSNLGFTAAGEVLNCNTYDVGLHAAVELRADKLFCLHLDDVASLRLPQWLPLSDARTMLLNRMAGVCTLSSMDAEEADRLREQLLSQLGNGRNGTNGGDTSADVSPTSSTDGGPGGLPPRASSSPYSSRPPNSSSHHKDFLLNMDLWHNQGFPTGVSVSVVACSKGVKRAHLVDARVDGGMLLELYSRDGVGTMISTDFYEGIRSARATDLDAVAALLAPLERAGVLVARARDDLRALLPNFYVLERETKVLGCVLLLPLGTSPDGQVVAEIGAFCVDPIFRGSGRGDSLLDYVEQDARGRGINRLVLLTTRTADWFVQRDFALAGPAWASALLPEDRRRKVDPARNSQLYVKELAPLAPGGSLPRAGKRIGF